LTNALPCWQQTWYLERMTVVKIANHFYYEASNFIDEIMITGISFILRSNFSFSITLNPVKFEIENFNKIACFLAIKLSNRLRSLKVKTIVIIPNF
jgi:hypothetical protein